MQNLIDNFFDNITNTDTFVKICAIIFFAAFTLGFTIGTLTEISILLEK